LDTCQPGRPDFLALQLNGIPNAGRSPPNVSNTFTSSTHLRSSSFYYIPFRLRVLALFVTE
jgi:hypothetical protein